MNANEVGFFYLKKVTMSLIIGLAGGLAGGAVIAVVVQSVLLKKEKRQNT